MAGGRTRRCQTWATGIAPTPRADGHAPAAHPPRLWHRVFGNLKTWLRGTHHGVGHDHLQVYLDDFAFRFNRRRTPMAAFQTLLGLASGAHGPTTYEMFYASSAR